ncbi:hypothetical protein APHAL10511_003054 [Amanita phalloides]|nr:hypothetical protein APHAL10511_003054 [Amanita phalloides]
MGPTTAMGPTSTVPLYFPSFIRKFWLSQTDCQREPTMHVYDVSDNVLLESTGVHLNRSILHDFLRSADASTKVELDAAEDAFANLEHQVEEALSEIIDGVRSNYNCKEIPIERRVLDKIRRYFLFLRFRNCEAYRTLIRSVADSFQAKSASGVIYSVYYPLVNQLHLRIILRTILAFLTCNDNPLFKFSETRRCSSTSALRHIREAMGFCCWSLLRAEVSVGVACEEQEFVLPETCYGTLTENYQETLECCDLFFPILPTFALYIMDSGPRGAVKESSEPDITSISVGAEFAIDVHLRNAMILNTYPKRLYFNSLTSTTRTLSSYDQFRWVPEHRDYSRLKFRCRQKFLQQGVTKTLVVKGSVALVDLTDDIELLGHSPVGFGSFSDVWKGVWTDNVEKSEKLVAVKCLRECMFRGVRDQLTKRLQAECIAWHRLCHRNVSQLYGLVQTSQSFGMVSPWCESGTIIEYVRANSAVDKMKLLVQVASGMAYLHSCQPVVIHGDLKGGNILINKYGCAVITDFGLSTVMEGITGRMGPSYFAGSIRWMAPELILAFSGDSGSGILVTTCSDVFAFAAVCLEVVTGQLPYYQHSTDLAVLVAILKGAELSRGVLKDTYIREEDAFWMMLDQCWTKVPGGRPCMQDVLENFQSMTS